MSLASWMRQSLTVASATGVDSYGKVTYGTQRTLKVSISEKTRAVRSVRGDETVATHVVYSLDPILLTDRIWLPGTSTATADGARVPLTVSTAQDKALARTLYKVEL